MCVRVLLCCAVCLCAMLSPCACVNASLLAFLCVFPLVVSAGVSLMDILNADGKTWIEWFSPICSRRLRNYRLIWRTWRTHGKKCFHRSVMSSAPVLPQGSPTSRRQPTILTKKNTIRASISSVNNKCNSVCTHTHTLPHTSTHTHTHSCIHTPFTHSLITYRRCCRL